MKTIRILTVLTAFLLIFGLAACGTGKDNGKSNGNKKAEIASLMAKEPGTKDEATELHQKLMEQQKFPGCGKKPSDGDMSVPAENGQPTEKGDLMKFPAFDGKDLDGNEVKSSTLFAGNTVTVVNFWFTTCSPCVGELADLEALNKQLAEKGGAVVGINSFTLDGDKTAIKDAKDILTKKGVSYKNVWFNSKSEAGEFTSGLYSYPTTYVVDKNGNIVGEPIVGAITAKKQAETLQKLINQAIANSKG